MSLVPILNGSMNWQAWRLLMMNYLLSQGQWKVIANKFPAPDYETTTTVTKTDAEGTHTETVADTSKPPKNQSKIDSWFDTNDRALGNIMLHLHPTLATTVLNLLEKTIEENTDVNTMFTSIAWEYLEATYRKPGIAATYKELKATMDVVIPRNTDPTLAIDTILIGFTRMAASKCAVPPHLQAMILVSKLPHQMSALVWSICQTDNIEDLKTDDIKRKAILAWEQRGPTTQNQNNRPFQQPHAAKNISAVQRSGPPHLFNNNSSNLNKRSSSTKGTRTLNEEVGEEGEEVAEEPLEAHSLVKTNSKTNNNRPQGLLRNVLHLPLPPSFLAKSLPPLSSLMFLVRFIRTSLTPSLWHTALAPSLPLKWLKGLKSSRGLKRNKGR